MRHPVRAVPAQPITYLWERHKEIARRLVAGERPIDVATALGMSKSRLSIITRSPAFIKYLDSLSSRRDDKALDVRGYLDVGASEGVQKLLDIMRKDDASDTLKAKIAQDFLDRTGHGKTTISKIEQTTVIFDAAKIEALKEKRRKMLEAMAGPSALIDITPPAGSA